MAKSLDTKKAVKKEPAKTLKEKRAEKKEKKANKKGPVVDEMQLSFFQLNDPVLEQIHEELKNVDINGLTPMDALLKLNEIKKLIGN